MMEKYTTQIKTIKRLKNSTSSAATSVSGIGRIILHGGRVIDPKNRIDRVSDIASQDGIITEIFIT